MRKITRAELMVISIVIMCFAFYFVPKMLLSKEVKQYGAIQTNASMMTSKVLAEFSDNKNTKKVNEVANSLIEEMNKLVKNPLDKKGPAYTNNSECLGCVVLTCDEKVKSIVITAKDKKGELITRTVIQPPSYVVFNKDLK